MPDDSQLAAGLRKGFAAYGRGDFDAVVATFHPDVEIVPLGDQPPIRGREAVREWLEPQAFEQTVELLEAQVQGDKALTRQRTRARGTLSGIELEVDLWSVWTYDAAGLVLRWEMYPVADRAAAFAAAGIA